MPCLAFRAYYSVPLPADARPATTMVRIDHDGWNAYDEPQRAVPTTSASASMSRKRQALTSAIGSTAQRSSDGGENSSMPRARSMPKLNHSMPNLNQASRYFQHPSWASRWLPSIVRRIERMWRRLPPHSPHSLHRHCRVTLMRLSLLLLASRSCAHLLDSLLGRGDELIQRVCHVQCQRHRRFQAVGAICNLVGWQYPAQRLARQRNYVLMI